MTAHVANFDVKPLYPPGVAQFTTEISQFIAGLKSRWELLKQQVPKPNFTLSTQFLVQAVDSLIQFMETSIPGASGADKKATVLTALGSLYDHIVEPLLPIWTKAFSSQIKNFVVNVLASSIIDWTVAHYHDGAWGPTPEVVPTPAV